MQAPLKALTRLPLPALYAGGALAYFVAYHLVRWRRRLAADNLRNAFPDLPEQVRRSILRQSYRNLSAIIAEALHGFGADITEMSARVQIENPELATQYIAQGQSVVLLAAHYCNWEWLLLGASAQFALPIDVVYKTQRVEAFDAFLCEARSRFGGNLIPHKRFLFEVMKARNEPRIYALVADQTPHSHEEKHWTRFLHQDTAFYVGADKIARILKAPAIFVTMRRLRPGFYSARLRLLAAPPYARGDEATIIESYARALEEEIRSSPADWLWIHRKWKYPKPLYA